MVLPFDLLYAEMVLVDGYAQDYLCAVLVHDELVQVLSQHLGRDEASAYITGVAQRAPGRLIRLIEGGEALAAEVGAVEPGGFARVRLRQGCAARDAIEGEVGRAGLGRDGNGEGPLDGPGQDHGGRGAQRDSHYKTYKGVEGIEGITRALINSQWRRLCSRLGSNRG